MNGLLHRIAARAAGTALAVRADVGQAYVGGASSGFNAGGASSGFDIVEAQPEAPAPIVDEGGHRPAPAAPMWPAQRAAMPGQASDRGLEAAPQVAPQGQPQAGFVQGPDPASAPQLAWPGPDGYDAPPSIIPPTAPHAFAQAPAAPEPARTLRGRADVALTVDPAPLMPQAATPAPLAPAPRHDRPQRHEPIARGPAAGAATPGSAAAGGDSEVHIHIGRIDVTALREAPPARRPAQAQAPQSLDSYLAKRGRS